MEEAINFTKDLPSLGIGTKWWYLENDKNTLFRIVPVQILDEKPEYVQIQSHGRPTWYWKGHMHKYRGDAIKYARTLIQEQLPLKVHLFDAAYSMDPRKDKG